MTAIFKTKTKFGAMILAIRKSQKILSNLRKLHQIYSILLAFIRCLNAMNLIEKLHTKFGANLAKFYTKFTHQISKFH